MFSLTEDQLKKITEWQSKHGKACVGAIGGRYTYSFTPTSIGMIVKVRDDVTGQELDLSDYDEW